jgi:hypothetical protein
MPVALFALVILEIGSHFMPGLAWTSVLLVVLLYIAGMTGLYQSAQLLLVEMGVS